MEEHEFTLTHTTVLEGEILQALVVDRGFRACIKYLVMKGCAVGEISQIDVVENQAFEPSIFPSDIQIVIHTDSGDVKLVRDCKTADRQLQITYTIESLIFNSTETISIESRASDVSIIVGELIRYLEYFSMSHNLPLEREIAESVPRSTFIDYRDRLGDPIRVLVYKAAEAIRIICEKGDVWLKNILYNELIQEIYMNEGPSLKRLVHSETCAEDRTLVKWARTYTK